MKTRVCAKRRRDRRRGGVAVGTGGEAGELAERVSDEWCVVRFVPEQERRARECRHPIAADARVAGSARMGFSSP